MISFPNAKINLGLRVVSRRSDGYHNIETVMLPVTFRDVLEILPTGDNQVEFTQTGIEIPGEAFGNLCIKAWKLFKKRTGQAGAKIHLHKAIPPGSGLGGGSSDAAATLILLNHLFHENMDESELLEMAAQLGSDCPFFIRNRPALATGRGEILDDIELPVEDKEIFLVLPGINVSTAWAYSHITPCAPAMPVGEVVKGDISLWRKMLVNDFEIPVFDAFPMLKAIRDQLYATGAIYAAMSGSGSAIFGIYDAFPKGLAEHFSSHRTCFVKSIN